jgi:formate dehydrogenase assembly factor FdhD
MPADPPQPSVPSRGFARRDVARMRAGAGAADRTHVADQVAEEVPVALRVNDRAFAVMMATPCDLEDFAPGFALTEGLVDTPAQLIDVVLRPRLEGIELAVAAQQGADQLVERVVSADASRAVASMRNTACSRNPSACASFSAGRNVADMPLTLLPSTPPCPARLRAAWPRAGASAAGARTPRRG